MTAARASCGQLSHSNSISKSGSDCYLFENLAKLGFTQQLMLGHNGLFGDFLKEVRSRRDAKSADGSNRAAGQPAGFDGSPVYDDLATLNRWLETENKQGNARNATFYNTLPLHDGNHFPARAKRRITKFARRNSSTSWTASLPRWKNRAVK